MVTKILRAVAFIVLTLSPFAPVTEQFFPEVGPGNFGSYLAFGSGIAVLMLLLAVAVGRKSRYGSSSVQVVIGLCFLTGVLVLFPLHLGPPREDPALLQHLAAERFRYLMLMVAILVFAAAHYAILTMLNLHANGWGKLITILLLLITLMNLWDNYDSFTFGSQMKAWIAAGKQAEDFFPSYDYHEGIRTAGRALLYVLSGITSILLWRRHIIAGWRACILSLFCFTGVVFSVLFVTKGSLYYFPFMVPAIALAPTYWTGLVLLVRKTSVPEVGVVTLAG